MNCRKPSHNYQAAQLFNSFAVEGTSENKHDLALHIDM